MKFFLFLAFLIVQRISELLIAKRNERWLRKQGAVEYGQKHYPYIVLLHIGFILSLVAEYGWHGTTEPVYFFLVLFFVLIAVKAWVIASLGNYWNTKIFRVPGAVSVRKGLYKFIRHPNYVIVVCEIAVIPLIFHLYYTALVFSVLNALMLRIRIREENKVWAK